MARHRRVPDRVDRCAGTRWQSVMRFCAALLALLLATTSAAVDFDDSQGLAETLHAIEALKDSDPASGQQQARELLARAEAYGDDLIIARVQRVLALNLNVLGRNDEALALLDGVVESFARAGDTDNEALALRNRGVVLFDSDRLDQAIDSYLAALERFEAIGDEVEQAKTLSNIGNVFFELGDLAQAAHYHRRALGVFEEVGLTIGIAGAAINLGAALRSQHDHPDYPRLIEEAEVSYNRALGAFVELGNQRGEMMALGNLAGLAELREDHERAHELISQAFRTAEASGDHRSILTMGHRLIRTLHASERSEEAVELAERLIGLARETGAEHYLPSLLAVGAEVLADIGQHQRALEMVRESVELEQRQLRAETEVRLNEVLARYESERLQRENLQLRQAEELARIQADRQRLTVYAAIAVAVLLLIALGALISRMRLRERARAELNWAATHDPLTAALNRRGLREALDPQADNTLGLLLIDIDHFKQINDRHGHDAGDSVLIAVVDRLRSRLDPADLLVRWGGEEFLIVRPDSEGLDGFARQLVSHMAQAPVDVDGVALSVTLSAGAAVKRATEAFSSAVRRADQALMAAKRDGRNRFRAAAGLEAG